VRARQLRPNPSPLPAGEPRRAVHGPAAEDALTGLANRALFLDRLSAVTASGVPLAVLFLDLDDFKLVNDG
jgi:diguanylate cyclase